MIDALVFMLYHELKPDTVVAFFDNIVTTTKEKAILNRVIGWLIYFNDLDIWNADG
jgi:hypothetical protein